MAVKDLYDLDFFEWTQQNAELLRKRCLSEIDVENLAEEVADMGKRDRREMDRLSDQADSANAEVADAAGAAL